MRTKRPLRIVLLGAPKVGKTAITVRYLTQRFIGEYSSREGTLYKHTVIIEGEKADLEIIDSCRYSVDRRDGDGYLVVFSVTEPSSFVEAEGILARLPQARPVLLLANKIDLEHTRSVSLRAALELSMSAGCPYLEVSAACSKTDRGGISLAFSSIAARARPSSPIRAAVRALAALFFFRKPCDSGRAEKTKWRK